MKIRIDTGLVNVKKILHTQFKERNNCLHPNKSQICVIWESESVSLLKTSEEVKMYLVLQAASLDSDIVVAHENYL